MAALSDDPRATNRMLRRPAASAATSGRSGRSTSSVRAIAAGCSAISRAIVVAVTSRTVPRRPWWTLTRPSSRPDWDTDPDQFAPVGRFRVSDTTVSASAGGRGIPGLPQLQRIGRSLMLPIAALPAAALLLRLGQPDMLGEHGLANVLGRWLEPVADVMSAAGGALFANLPVLFAVGVAIGFARKSDGSTALAALVGYVVFKAVTDAMSPYILGEAVEGDEQELI